MADAGVAARRACEALIEAGRVRVNGETVTRLPVFVDPQADRVEVDGRPLRAPERLMYVMVHKPEGTLVAAADGEFGRRTVLDLVDHPAASRLFPVGRLDLETDGLVLLTNDGELANRLTHPRYEIPKTYHAAVRGPVDDAALAAIVTKTRLAAQRDDAERGRRRPGGHAPVIRVVRRDPGRTTIEVTLRDARSQGLRDALKHLGMPVKKLTRVALGPLQLKGLAVGGWRELTRQELQDLRKAARAAGTGGSTRTPQSPRPRTPKKHRPRRIAP